MISLRRGFYWFFSAVIFIVPAQAEEMVKNTDLSFDTTCCVFQQGIVFSDLDADEMNQHPVVGVAQFDLDADGKQDFISRTTGSYFCGMQNCPVSVYMQRDDRRYIRVLSLNAAHLVRVSDKKTQGVHDVLFPRAGGGYSQWTWNGTTYVFDREVE